MYCKYVKTQILNKSLSEVLKDNLNVRLDFYLSYE